MSVPSVVVDSQGIRTQGVFTSRLINGVPKLLIWRGGSFVEVNDAGLVVPSSLLLGELQSDGIYSCAPFNSEGSPVPSAVAYNGNSFVPILDTCPFTDPQQAAAPVPPPVVAGIIPPSNTSFIASAITYLQNIKVGLINLFLELELPIIGNNVNAGQNSGGITFSINAAFESGYQQALLILQVAGGTVAGASIASQAIADASEASMLNLSVSEMFKTAMLYLSTRSSAEALEVIQQLSQLQTPNSALAIQIQQLLAEWAPSALAGEESFAGLISQMNSILAESQAAAQASMEASFSEMKIVWGTLVGSLIGTSNSTKALLVKALITLSTDITSGLNGMVGNSSSMVGQGCLANAIFAFANIDTSVSSENYAAAAAYSSNASTLLNQVANSFEAAALASTNSTAKNFYNEAAADAIQAQAALVIFIKDLLSGNLLPLSTDFTNVVTFVTQCVNDLTSALAASQGGFIPIQVTPQGFRPFDSPITVTLRQPTQAGSTLIAFISPVPNNSFSPTDDQDNTWQQMSTGGDWADSVGHEQDATNPIDQIFYAQNVKAGTTTIAFNVSGTVDHLDILVMECSGLGALDKVYPAASDTGAWYPPPNGSGGFLNGVLPITTTQGNEVIISWWYAYPQGASPGFVLGPESTLIYDSSTDVGTSDPSLVYNWMLGFQAAPTAGPYTSTAVSSADPMESVSFVLADD